MFPAIKTARCDGVPVLERKLDVLILDVLIPVSTQVSFDDASQI